MKNRYLFLAAGLAFLISCTSTETDTGKLKQEAVPTEETIPKEDAGERSAVDGTPAASDTVALVHDDFILRVLEQDLLLSTVAQVYSKTKPQSKFVSNYHYPEQLDTLVTFVSGADTILFHKGIGNTVLESMHLATPAFTLDRNIRVGVPKTVFERKFSRNFPADKFVLLVQDTEGGNTFHFVFNEGTLSEILFNVLYF